MSDWSPSQYLKFKSQRTRPASDLASRLSSLKPRSIIDIGCGPGNSTAVVKELFPFAKITGIDSSPDMITRAKAEHPDISFELCDATAITGTYDIIFSNACLQWIPNHETLLPYLISKLNIGGVLAVQVPVNSDEPLFRLIEEITSEEKWGLRDVENQPNEALTPDEYLDILSEHASSFELWETKYRHPMKDHEALVDWVKGTRLRPYLNALDECDGKKLLAEITERSRGLYPFTKSGEVILGFKRLFFTAVR